MSTASLLPGLRGISESRDETDPGWRGPSVPATRFHYYETHCFTGNRAELPSGAAVYGRRKRKGQGAWERRAAGPSAEGRSARGVGSRRVAESQLSAPAFQCLPDLG